MAKLKCIRSFGQIVGQIKIKIGEAGNKLESDKNNPPYYGDEKTTIIDTFASWTEVETGFYTCQWGNYGKVDLTPIQGELMGYKILIPKDYDKILRHLYGDYTKPKKEKGINLPRKNYFIK